MHRAHHVSESPTWYQGALRRLRDWKLRYVQRSELQRAEPEELARIAHDMGVNASDLRMLAGRDSGSADLLDARLALLHIDRETLTRTHPGVLHDLQRLCTLCRSQKRCARDLAAGQVDGEWERYCPNAATLRELRDSA